ncbi:MAG: hypothetical protein KAJ95_11555, partial [Gammaproteobacteria bacterium]|nr:hypothetical protein [Gammaproteobacteria bacterium]
MKVPDSEPWHAESVKTVFDLLDTSAAGLSAVEVSNRISKYGSNRLPESGTRGPLLRFFYQFHNVLIYVLLSASVVTAMLGHWVDASV